MKKATRILIAAALLAATLPAQIVPNMPAPRFTIKDLGGNTITLEGLKGKIVVLNFWATWCPPCRAEIPDFVAFYAANKNKGLEIVGVSVDTIGASQVLAFARQNKMSYPVAMSTEKILGDYGPIDAIPTTFIIDKGGRVRHVQVGLMDEETLSRVFAKISAEK